MIGGFGTKDKESRGQQMASIVKIQKEEKFKYYFNRIIELMDGSHKMGMHVINLESIKGWCHYYGIDDTIVYWDGDMKKALIDNGIASYLNSANGLVITTADYRVEQQKGK